MKRLVLIIVWVVCLPVLGVTRYVAPTGGNVAPFTNGWTSAATNIQDAVNVSVDGDMLMASNGMYNLPGTLIINHGVTVKGVAGAGATMLNAQYPFRTNRCVEMGATGAVLDGFTVTRGHSMGNNGGGVLLSYGVVRNCIISNNFNWKQGAGVYCSAGTVIDGCLIAQNGAQDEGGGIFFNHGGVATNCTVWQNSTLNYAGGGGVALYYGGLLVNSLVEGNLGGTGGGVYPWYGGTVRGCVIVGNVGKSAGGGAYCASAGGIVESCTIAGNRAVYAGGVFASYGNGSVRNCIITGNDSLMGPNWWGFVTTSQFRNCCSSPAPPGNGNMDLIPSFTDAVSGDYRLLPGSPCIDKGFNQAWMTNAVDRAGTERIVNSIVDIGAFEYKAGVLACNFTPDAAQGFAPVPVTFQAFVGGANTSITYYGWDVQNDGMIDYTGPQVIHTYPSCGWYTVHLTVSNTAGEVARVVKPGAIKVGPATVYVALESPAVFPYATWAAAASHLQMGIDAAVNGSLVLVSNGVYAVTNHVAIASAITVRSVGGPSNAIIQAAASIRCVHMYNCGAVLSGFTLQNGWLADSQAWPGNSGGGAMLMAGTITNCVMCNNNARYGGGLFTAEVYTGTPLAVGCELYENGASGDGAGADLYYRGVLSDSTVHDNAGNIAGGVSLYGGSGFEGAVLRKSRVLNNTANGTGFGGGIELYHGGKVENTLVLNNTAKQGGGVFIENGGAFANCTIVSNTASDYGGGVYCFVKGTGVNSIVQHNTAPTGPDYNGSIVCMNSCAGSLLPGTNNITADPLFVNEGAGDFHLAAGSPCRNTGSNQFAALPWDLSGRARIAESVVDMGAYEFIGGPAIVVLPAVLNFGTLVVDEASTAAVSVINGGSLVLTGAVSGVQAPFVLLSAAGYILPDGAGSGVTFQFAPSSVGVFSNIVTCSGGGSATVLLTGSAVPEPIVPGVVMLIVSGRRRRPVNTNGDLT